MEICEEYAYAKRDDEKPRTSDAVLGKTRENRPGMFENRVRILKIVKNAYSYS